MIFECEITLVLNVVPIFVNPKSLFQWDRDRSNMDKEYNVIVLGMGLKECIHVASIQDAKDRFSQIEYVFYSLLYPHFKSDNEWKCRCIEQLKRDADEKAKLLLHAEERRNAVLLK